MPTRTIKEHVHQVEVEEGQEASPVIAVPTGGVDEAALEVAVETAVAADATIPRLLADPGNVWEAEHLYAEGDRILIDFGGGPAILQASGHTSGTDEPVWPEDYTIAGGVDDDDGDGQWSLVGFVGEVPYATLGGIADVAAGGAIASANDLPKLLTLPGSEWEAETAVLGGDRIAYIDGLGYPRVFECTDAGTTGTDIPDFAGAYPLDVVQSDGTVTWQFVGFAYGVPFEAVVPTAETVLAADVTVPKLLTDPGNIWEAETAVVEGYRIADSDMVFEIVTPGTTDTVPPTWVPSAFTISDGTAGWLFIGRVSQVPRAALSDIVSVMMFDRTVPLTSPTLQNVIDQLAAAFGLQQSD